MDRWLVNNPTAACLGKFDSIGNMQFSNELHLWKIFDISVGLDDVFIQPTDDAVIQHLQNRFVKLGDRRCVYATRIIPLRDALTEELYSLGIERLFERAP